jgi:hypothetical protein
MQALTTTVRDLSPLDAVLIRTWLTRPGSEFQAEVTDATSDTPIAIVRSQDEWVAAWTATHNWRGMQTLEGFTHPSCRRRGLARVAAAMLIAEGHIDPHKTLAVFSPLCVSLASGLSCRDVRLFERQGKEWVENS